MVVAIFLAFLGINSFLNNLLEITTQSVENITVIPNNNHSELELGILFFILYVILSLFTKPSESTTQRTRFGQSF